MNRSEFVVLGVDPGLTTGWSYGQGKAIHEHGEKEAYAFLDWLSTMLATGFVDRVVVERVDPRRWDNDTRFTVEVAGVVRWLAHHSNTPYAEVNAGDRMKVIQEIPAIGRHARDAEAIRLWDYRYGRW
jgi:hypothetical protein